MGSPFPSPLPSGCCYVTITVKAYAPNNLIGVLAIPDDRLLLKTFFKSISLEWC